MAMVVPLTVNTNPWSATAGVAVGLPALVGAAVGLALQPANRSVRVKRRIRVLFMVRFLSGSKVYEDGPIIP
jgi:hypothetical protein